MREIGVGILASAGVIGVIAGNRGDLFVEDATGTAVKLIAVVTATDGDATAPLRWEVREALLTFLQQNYPAALPGGQ